MKLIIDVEKDYHEMIKYNVEHGQDYKPFEIIANGIPYDKVIDEVTELLENEWGYEGMKDDVARIMNSEIATKLQPNCNKLQPKQGEWIATPNGDYVCNKCSWVIGKFERNFCPNCGVRMKGSAE